VGSYGKDDLHTVSGVDSADCTHEKTTKWTRWHDYISDLASLRYTAEPAKLSEVTERGV